MKKLRITPQSYEDCLNIWRFIDKENPDAAIHLINIFKQKLNLIRRFPGIGQKSDFVTRLNLQSYPVGNYILFYTLHDDQIVLLRVIHGNRDLKSIWKQSNP